MNISIIVKDLSRFGRDYIELGDYMEQFFSVHGIRVISVNDYYARETSKKEKLAQKKSAETGIADEKIVEMNFESHAFKNMNSDTFEVRHQGNVLL